MIAWTVNERWTQNHIGYSQLHQILICRAFCEMEAALGSLVSAERTDLHNFLDSHFRGGIKQRNGRERMNLGKTGMTALANNPYRINHKLAPGNRGEPAFRSRPFPFDELHSRQPFQSVKSPI